ncbi:conserved phage C-terminal domain-containing protein [Pantoea brenneri]|uniref:conserved phage C-terminal domain-containing protein n=1 Tax=Pantoea brenneri TaxID=472694 RepID=UPI00244BC808|nr:conserved phage C-terminal domain-containing protein [Pantoea brenneri]MDH2122994.1 conserved phage C-terminal domain-containing protein [Pantoea brenneri]
MSLLLKVKPLVISPELAQRIGLNEAIVLQQICYWLEDTTSGVEHAGRRWVYNTIEEWTNQFPFWSEKTVKRALTSLKAHGLIYVEQLKKTQHDRTNFYSINHSNPLLADGDKLTPSKKTNCPHREGQSVPMDKVNLSQSIGSTCPTLTEITTENTTEITTTPSCQVAGQPDHAPDANQAAFSVLEHLNRAAGMRFQKSKSSLAPIRGRLAEDFTADELILTVDYSIAKWAEDPKMCEYVRPETIFRPGKFPGYLSSAQKWDKAGRPKCINGKWQRDVMAISSMDYEIPNGFRGA